MVNINISIIHTPTKYFVEMYYDTISLTCNKDKINKFYTTLIFKQLQNE